MHRQRKQNETYARAAKNDLPNLITVGCSAHYMNLVEKEVTLNTVLKHIVEVQKHFMYVHQAHEWLKEKGCLAPQIPNTTRWNSQVDCVKTYVKNHHIYVQIRTEQEAFNADIARIIDNIGLYREAQNLLKQLKIVERSLDSLQADKTTLSDAYETWSSVIKNADLAPFRKAFEKRFVQAMEPVHYLANLTDPRYFGQGLTPQQENDAEQWISVNKPDFLPALLLFKIKDVDTFPASMFSEAITKQFTAAKWWRIMESKCLKLNTVSGNFCKFFSQLRVK